ncbi:uncharacterized protein BDW43DRAFT_233453 [Aspergillus alliaceus]|uniref:uncharacterized protein n=1 Tax=Petromyces alliaceus TaxID=209559 RepID=UPI0012A7216A|nr:uncharacterized protein BDW43DRAFT_233453 [Aspergillus alliaceus]KAB8227952.1 hypothetical protein BDW43DRAFT_233453 [Aspergillus alliaceus]
MSYNVYTAEYAGKPNYVAIYIETKPNALQVADRGRLYHVTGNILQGMKYDPRDSRDPIESASFVPGTKIKIRTIAKGDLARFETECCKAVPPPPAQMTLGGKRLDPSKPLYRCGEWIQDVKKLTFEKGIFKP